MGQERGGLSPDDAQNTAQVDLRLRLNYPHPVSLGGYLPPEQLLNDAFAGGVVRNAERFVFDVLAEACRVDFDGGLEERERGRCKVKD